MNMLISSLSSPGYNLKWEKRFVVFGVSLSAFISLGFFASLLKEISRLYYVDGGTRYLSQNAVCSSFSDIVGGFFYGFTVTALTSLFFNLAESFGANCYETKVGFKNVALNLLESDSIIGIENNGIDFKPHSLIKDGP